MQKQPATIRSGEHVEVRGEPWLVVHIDPFADASVVTLRGLGLDNHGETMQILAPFNRVAPLHDGARLHERSRRRALGAAAWAVADASDWTDCRTAASARIDIRAFQLEPARAALEGASRFLLSDEVGLGKTVQALLIVAELAERGLARRLLVLTPAALGDQSAAEMSSRFGLRATIFDHVSLAQTRAELPVGVNPWSTAPLIVSSIDLVKRPEVRQAIDAVALDVLVVDEAHHLTPGSDRAAVVADLAARTPVVILVTATPHSGDAEAYRLLGRLGQVDADDPLVVFRRSAAHVDASRTRRVRIVAVGATEAEQAMLAATLEYATALWRSPGGPGAQLVASVIARRACSSADAARRTIERRLGIMTGAPDPQEQSPLPWEDDAPDDSVPDRVIGAPGLPDRVEEIAWLQRLVPLTDRASQRSSKLEIVRRLLVKTRESVVIFSEYRDVVEWFASRLADVASVAILHGGLSPALRRGVVGRFNNGGVRALVTTDAAGEGLNLQARCRLVVNLELPWNPLRIDQRSGRVDRLGQTRRVHVRHLVHRGSFEDVVLARLERRRLSAIGDLGAAGVAFGEGQVASTVLGGSPIAGETLPPQVPPPVMEASAARVRLERRLRTLARPNTPGTALPAGIYGVGPPKREAARAVTLIFAADIIDSSSSRVQREIVAVKCTPPPLRPLPRRLSKRLARACADHAAVQEVVGRELTGRLVAAQARLGPTASHLERRALALLSALSSRQGDALIQGSLFDRREEQRSRARAANVKEWREHLQRRLEVARALTAIRLTNTRLLAAWLDH